MERGKKEKRKKRKTESFYTKLIKMTSSHSRIRAIKRGADIFRWILTVNDAILKSTSTQPSPGRA